MYQPWSVLFEVQTTWFDILFSNKKNFFSVFTVTQMSKYFLWPLRVGMCPNALQLKAHFCLCTQCSEILTCMLLWQKVFIQALLNCSLNNFDD